MNRTEKEQIVEELAGKLSETKAAFIADYRGINVDQVTRMRRELVAAGVDYRVVKKQPAASGLERDTCCRSG